MDVTAEVLNGMMDSLFKIKSLDRWGGVANGIFNESEHQALSVIFEYILANECIHNGKEIHLEIFPKISIHRIFEKIILCNTKSLDIEALSRFEIRKEQFDDHINQTMSQRTSELFCKETIISQQCIEYRLYRLASKMATLLEAYILKESFPIPSDWKKKVKEIKGELKVHRKEFKKEISAISKKYWNFLLRVATLRNNIRWAKCATNVKPSVLSHLFEVAVFAYLIACSRKESEKKPTEFFFIGAFHDVPEVFTGDIPSPVKDAIPGLRKATEEWENLEMKEKVYSKFPSYMADAIRRIMLEDKSNIKIKEIIKLADYFAASNEAYQEWRQIDLAYFKNVISEYKKKLTDLPMVFQGELDQMEKKINF